MKGQRVGNLLERRAPSASFEWTALETELKLSVATEDLDVLKNHPIFRSRKSSAKGKLVSIYFDTKDRMFNRHGLSFRLRRKGEQLRQTIKGMHRGVLNAASGKPRSSAMVTIFPVQSIRFCSILIETCRQHLNRSSRRGLSGNPMK
jgi:hypothetical protein